MEVRKEKPNPFSKMFHFAQSKKGGIFLDVVFMVLSFALAFSLLCVLFASHGFEPFNPEGPSTMMMDQRDQYISYLRYYQAVLRGEGSLVYTLGKVFGGDFMSLFTYYLASPFNLLIVWINEASLPTFFTFSAMAKLSFAALNFYLLCRFTLKKTTPLYIAFGLGYALMSYNLIYMSNFMYLDGIMVLPLVILGILFLEEGKHRWLYLVSLAYALMTCWYLGSMICIFAVLFYLSRLLVAKNRLAFTLRFGVFSFLAGMLVAAFWLTAFLHFEGTKATSSMPKENKWFPLTIFFSGWLENSYSSRSDISRNTGYMTMFVGMAPLVFTLLYPFNPRYKVRERLGDYALFLILVVSSLSKILSALWHGGREPSWFPTRFSFLMGFLVCFLAAKEAVEVGATKKYGLLLPTALLGVVLPVVLLIDNQLSETDPAYYSLSGISLALYLISLGLVTAYLFLPQWKAHWKNRIKAPLFAVGIIVIAAVSSYRGACRVVETNLSSNTYAPSSLYQRDCALSPAINYVKGMEASPAFRMETTFNRPGGTNVINNNPLFYQYNGLNHYSSTEKKSVSNYMKKLGFHINYFYETYDGGSTAAINSFLGVKYLIDDGEGTGAMEPIFQRNPESVYQPISSPERMDYSYMKNDFALPLGFVTASHGVTFVNEGTHIEGRQSTYWFDDIEYQNSIYSSLTKAISQDGKAKPIFNAIPAEVSLSSGLTFTENEHGIRSYTGPKGSSITYTFTVPEKYYGQTLYFGVKDTPNVFDFNVDHVRYRVNDYFYAGIRGFPDTANHRHTIRITATEELKAASLRPEIYAEDHETLKQYLTELKKGGLKDAKEIKTLFTYGFKGHFDFDGGDKEFLFTIPYEKEIEIRLDGKNMEVLLRNNVFSAISLAGVEAGTHEIEILYVDRPFQVGLSCSVGAALLTVPALIFMPRLESVFIRKRKDGGVD